MIDATFSEYALSDGTERRYVQVAQIEVDAEQSENQRTALRKQIEAAFRKEPSSFMFYAVSEQDNPAQITVFEIYGDMAAHKSHLESAHCKKYKAMTETMVKSLMLIRLLGTLKLNQPGEEREASNHERVIRRPGCARYRRRVRHGLGNGESLRGGRSRGRSCGPR